MGNCTSGMDALPAEGTKGMSEAKIKELLTKALSSKDVSEDQLEKLISSEVDVNSQIKHKSFGKCYPLHVATKAGNLKAVQLLLKAKADPNLCDEKEQTPLHWAIEDSQTEIIDELLEAKADPSICSEDGIAPLNLAVKSNNDDLVNKLIKAGAAVNVDKGEAPLVTAVKGNYIDIIMVLLRADASPMGLDFGFPEGESLSLLTWATNNGHEEMAALLTEIFSTAESPAIEEMENEIKEASEREGGDGAEEAAEALPEGKTDEPAEGGEPDGGEENAEAGADAAEESAGGEATEELAGGEATEDPAGGDAEEDPTGDDAAAAEEGAANEGTEENEGEGAKEEENAV